MEKTLAELSLLADAIATAFGPVVDAINDFIEMIASDDCDNCEEKENWPKNQRIGIPRHSPLSHRMRIAWYTGGFL